METGRLYESAKYHNVVFVGRDWEGNARYAALRGAGTDFIGEANGSFLKEYLEVTTVVFHLDNDRAGKLAAKAIQTVLPKKYQIRDEPPSLGKDYNDFLCIKSGLKTTKREKRS